MEANNNGLQAADEKKHSSTCQYITTFVIIVVDIVLVALVFMPTLIFHFGIKSFHRGFFCDDESLMHPYKSDTISVPLLLGVSISVSLLGIIILECIYFFQLRRNRHSKSPDFPGEIFSSKYGCVRVHAVFNNVLTGICYFFSGIAVVLVLTETGKVIVGRMRPHFFSACKPNWTQITCQVAIGSAGSGYLQMAYVENYQCLETNLAIVVNATKSFPSGHSSTAMYCAVFMGLYVHYRIHWNRLVFLKLFLQSIAILLAVLVCLSRITDYKHHWSDVLAGGVLGAAVAYYIVFTVSRLPRRYWALEKKLLQDYWSIKAKSVVSAHEVTELTAVDDHQNGNGTYGATGPRFTDGRK